MMMDESAAMLILCTRTNVLKCTKKQENELTNSEKAAKFSRYCCRGR